MFQFTLPDPGEGLAEADIVHWLVAPGDEVKVNDIIVEIETAKSLVELPAPVTGTVARLLVDEGDTVEVGAPIITIDDGSGVPVPDSPQTATSPDVAASPATPLRATDPLAESVAGGAVPNPTAAASTTTVSGGLDAQADGPSAASSNLVGYGPAPAARRRRRPRIGVVPAEPIRADRDDQATCPRDAAAAERREPITGVRKVTAQAMVDSTNTHVTVTEWVDVDITATMEMVEALRKRRDFAGLRITPLLLHAKAVCLAMSATPVINASWDEEHREIVYHPDVNLGIAAATPRGLMVPTIRGAQKLRLGELCRAINDLVTTSKEGRLQPADYSGGTFTLTNVGVFGVDSGTPVINGNESAILVMGSITRRPWVVGSGAHERIEPRWVTTLALGFDHRLIDGEQGSRFLHDVAAILHEPGQALLF